MLIEDKFDDIEGVIKLSEFGVNKDDDVFKNFDDFIGKTPDLEEYEFLLVDLKFAEEKQTGIEILESLSQQRIPIPVFVLSWTHTAKETSKIVSKGLADWYIHKSQLYYLDRIWENYKRDILRIPKVLEESLDSENPNDGYFNSKFLVDFITLARRHSGMLWYGMKPMHLNEHGFYHSSNLWKMAYSLASVIYLDNEYSGEHALAFALSIWLHDIGMKGANIARKSWEIRKQHGVLSGYLLDEYFDDYIFNLSIGNGAKKVLIKKYVQILSTYHLRKTPLSPIVVDSVGREDSVADYCKVGSKYSFLPAIAESGKSDLIKEQNGIFYVSDEGLKYYTAWLRFLDAADFNKNRIGWREEENIRLWMNYQELLSLVKESLKEDIPLIENHYKKIIENIETKTKDKSNYSSVNLYKLYKLISEFDTKGNLIKKQVKFHLEAPLHYKTHSLIKDLKIEVGDNKKVRFKYYVDFPFLFNCEKQEKLTSILYLFRECWKIVNYVKGDYYPVKNLIKLEDNYGIYFDFVVTSDGESKASSESFSFNMESIPIEAELKYVFDTRFEAEEFLKEVFNRILGKKFNEGEKKLNRDFYFDTNSKILWKNGWLIRKRETNKGKKEWTVKVSPLLEDLFQTRIEEKVVLKGGKPKQVLEKMLKKYGLNSFDFCLKEKLERQYIIETKREKWINIKFIGHKFTISLDETMLLKDENNSKNKLVMVEIESRKKKDVPIAIMFDLKQRIKEKTKKEPVLTTKLEWVKKVKERC